MEQTNVYHYSIDDVKKLVQQESVTTVSFDLFDTLLVRPSMKPTDIFYLLQKKVLQEYDLDFVALRLHAEEELHNDDATITDIWNWIGKKNGLNLGVMDALMNLEVELETRLLTVHKEMLSVLQCAKKAGKRVIITSDMYLGAEILSQILEKKGITEIDAVYVSCDLHARKSSGKIYKLIAQKEGVKDPSQIVHIGDNVHSDYQMALNAGITAVYYPSIWEDACGKGRPWEGALGEHVSQDPYARLLMSYAILYTYLVRGRAYDANRCFENLGDIASLYLGNVLLAVSIDLLNNKQIQKMYDSVSFAARDGYLPKKIYDILADTENALPSRYFQASRQALSYTSYTDFFDYFDNCAWGVLNQSYRLEDYIRLVIIDKPLASHILSLMTDTEKSIDLSKHLLEARKVLSRYKQKLDIYFSEQSKLARQYYSEQFPQDGKRYLVFDCGYSGSLSVGLMGARKDSGIKFDKYYIWETEANKKRDQKNGTKTFCLSQSDNFTGINLILEECFSPLEGSCLGFERQEQAVVVVQDRLLPDERMKQAMSEIQGVCEAYAKYFKELFAPYLESFILMDRDVLTRAGHHAFLNSPYMELSLLKDIRFTDSLIGGVPIELSKKVYDSYEMTGKYMTVFHGTQFLNPDVYVLPRRETTASVRIGIHQHVHYLHVMEEFICYLKDFPLPFDLIITTTQPQGVGAIRNLCTALLPNLKELKIVELENRGRDVAPWLVGTRPFQKDYDLFCHLHGKASVEYNDEVGTKWRRYLLDNLISHNAAADIIEMFEKNADIGCIFPRYYDYITNICVSNGIPLVGEFGEQKMIERLMCDMHINRPFSRDDLLYSCGQMLWYRPKAMQPLFDLKLTMEDFPEEPVPNGGTIAHAIERMPGIICESQGYRSVIFNEVQPITKQDVPSMLPAPGPTPTFAPAGIPFRTWSGHPLKWYIKKFFKSLFPYGLVRVWQRIRYKY